MTTEEQAKMTNSIYWAILIAKYGLDFVIELKQVLSKGEPTVEDFQNLKVKYGTKTEEQYVEEARQAKLGI
jgi:hypothetical protein